MGVYTLGLNPTSQDLRAPGGRVHGSQWRCPHKVGLAKSQMLDFVSTLFPLYLRLIHQQSLYAWWVCRFLTILATWEAHMYNTYFYVLLFFIYNFEGLVYKRRALLVLYLDSFATIQINLPGKMKQVSWPQLLVLQLWNSPYQVNKCYEIRWEINDSGLP